jgi:hypothetical protein
MKIIIKLPLDMDTDSDIIRYIDDMTPQKRNLFFKQLIREYIGKESKLDVIIRKLDKLFEKIDKSLSISFQSDEVKKEFQPEINFEQDNFNIKELENNIDNLIGI